MENKLDNLYKQYFQPLYRFAVGLTGDIDEASDIVQNIFARIASRKDLEDLEINKSYLFLAVRNGAKDFWKRKKAIPFSLMNANDSENEESFFDIAEDARSFEETHNDYDLSDVLKAFDYLTEQQREILSLKYFSGFSNHEVALEIGKSENAVRQMEFRALHTLRRKIPKI